MVPRAVFPGRFYFVTRRATQRQFLLRPDEDTNNAFVYCLADAAARYGIDVIQITVMSNHHHAVVFDRRGEINAFTEHLHKYTAKCINVIRGRSENLWSSEPVCKIKCLDGRSVMAKVVYAAINPVKDFLVDTVAHWPGVNSLYSLLNDCPLHATRPRHFFRDDGPMPEQLTLRLVLPPELGDPEAFRQTLRERVHRIEKHFAELRARTGRRVLGRQRVLRQSWRDSPTSNEPRRGQRQYVAARNRWACIEATLRDRQFLAEYRAARTLLLAGRPAVFPPGTYWLQRFAGVTVAPLPA